MTEQTPDPEDQLELGDDPLLSDDSSVIQALRQQLKSAKEEAARGRDAEARAKVAEEQAAEAAKRAVLLEAGLKPGTARYELTVKAHEGEWTLDSVRGTLIKYNLTPTQVTPERIAQMETADTAATGATAAGSSSDPMAELAALPRYGEPGWEHAADMAVAIAQKHGVEIDRSRPREQRWINPATGAPIKMTPETPAPPRPRGS